MITKLNTAVAAPESKGIGLGGVLLFVGVCAAIYFGIKHFTKKPDEQNH